MFIFPKTDIAHVWMGWTYGVSNHSKATLRERLPALQSPFSHYAFLNQTHSDSIYVVENPDNQGEGDGLITKQKGLGLVVQTADCVPIFLISPTEVAVVHSGWKGTAQNIVGKCIAQMQDVHTAIIGPSIDVHNYEVGEEVVEGIVATGVDRGGFVVEGDPRPYAHVASAVKIQIEQHNIKRIEILEGCTFEDDNWASYRRDGQQAGRILSVIGWL